jgi:hypothetical protein
LSFNISGAFEGEKVKLMQLDMLYILLMAQV